MKNGNISSTILLKSLFKLFYTEVSKVDEKSRSIAYSMTEAMGFENKVKIISDFSCDEEIIEIIKETLKNASKKGYFCTSIDYDINKKYIIEDIICGQYFLDKFVTNEELEDKNNVKTLLKYKNSYLIDLANRISVDKNVIDSVCELYDEGDFSINEIKASLEYFKEYREISNQDKIDKAYEGMKIINKSIKGKSLK